MTEQRKQGAGAPALPACNILTPGRPQVSNKIGIHEKTRAVPPRLASQLPPAAPPHQTWAIPELSTALLTGKSLLDVPALSCCSTISSQVLVSLIWSMTLEHFFKRVSCRGFCRCHHRLCGMKRKKVPVFALLRFLLWKTREAFSHKCFWQFRFNSSNPAMTSMLCTH